MVKKPIVSNNPNIKICAPYELVFLNNQFVGFIMLKAFNDSLSLVHLTFGYDLSKSKYLTSLSGFDGFNGLKPLHNRLVIANNIAYAIALLYQTGHYVLVDIKPENILITAQGNISLIDIDSVQITEQNNTKLLFAASAWTENYRPPEAKNYKDTDIIMPCWDSFSFGVLAYEIIIGRHPYSGNYQSPYDKGTDSANCIDNGLFLQDNKERYLITKNGLETFFRRYKALPKLLRDCFFNAFETGHYVPTKRPTMKDWGNAFSVTIQEIQKILKSSDLPY